MSNNMSCNLETGVCEVNMDVDLENYVYKKPELKGKVLMEYYTDPLCSACFAFEPVIEEVKERFKDQIEFRNIMGGMMPKNTYDKQEREKAAKGIEEMGRMFNMPMSGTLMRENPVDSSYPPSIAYLAVLKQDDIKADIFLRKLREAVYVLNKDVSKEMVLVDLVKDLDLDVDKFMEDFYSKEVLDELEDHIAYTIMNGVSGFPSIVIHALDGKSMIFRGINDFNVFSDSLLKLGVVSKAKKEYSLEEALNKDYYMSLREIADRMNLYFADDLPAQLEKLDSVERVEVSDGYYYKLRK